jgi:ribosome-associated translation inhibitor RaiA/cold shock CspA family protein
MARSESIAAHVERRAQKLETFFDRMTRCLVVVEAPHRHKRHGKRYRVRIDMHVPGRELVVSKILDDNKEDLHAAVDDAFGDAERVLEEYKRVLDGDTKTRHGAQQGIVTKLFDGYGFIDEAGREIYFHENSVLGGRFDKITLGTRVRFSEEDGDKGPQASTVVVS